ncbi:putative Pyranose dehydrogenase 3 [Seiridium unicorne]|uniref:Pyranose dehydrogenase 3 n=1 Tax=Seiridium unicorne TaxID=138068 RepID=A0ABR2V987_9PEZI
MLWDYIVVGGGLGGSVVSSRLHEYLPTAQILLLEAGINANNREDIMWYNSTNLVFGGEFDWNYTTIPQVNADLLKVNLTQGKALGGGTVINKSMWVRGDRVDYDEWAQIVGDERWSYDGQLPYFKQTETHWAFANAYQHGYHGNQKIQSALSTNRSFPLREKVYQAWHEIGVQDAPYMDNDGGEPIGISDYSENRNKGRREIASAVYPLNGVTVSTQTLVANIVLDRSDSESEYVAKGVRLANGTEILGRQVLLSAGAIRTPQLLMLSGIGPSGELAKHAIEHKVESPDVGRNLADHVIIQQFWKIKNPDEGWAVGSDNPIFEQAQYGWGMYTDFIVSAMVPNEGLAEAIEQDEGVPPNASHSLLQNRFANEHVILYDGQASDGKTIKISTFVFMITARGSITLASSKVEDPPIIDPNYLGTAVDRYVLREGLRQQIALAGGNTTILGQEILDGNITPSNFSEPLSAASTDEYLDARIRAAVKPGPHPMGTAAMGKVVDTRLRVKGVSNLRIVDASVFPVALAAHLQVPTYALAEQASVIIARDTGGYPK